MSTRQPCPMQLVDITLTIIIVLNVINLATAAADVAIFIVVPPLTVAIHVAHRAIADSMPICVNYWCSFSVW